MLFRSLVECILRHPRRIVYQMGQSSAGALIFRLIILSLTFAATYGVIVGSFSGGEQWWAAPLKIASGMLMAVVICLPSLYIFATLSGSTARLVEVAGAVAGLMGIMSLLLIGFAPVAWLFSQSTESVAAMGTLHLAFWMVALVFGIRFLNEAFRYFGLQTSIGINVWVLIFVLVALQMTTALRPLVGRAETLLPTEKRFFFAHWMSLAAGSRR